MVQIVTNDQLKNMMQNARNRTLELVDGLTDEQMMGPQIRTVNPLLWEIGHVAYFHEYFILRSLYNEESVIGDRADELYDSIAVHHDTRWDLPLLSEADTLDYMQTVQDRLFERLEGEMASEQDSFMYQFATFHEDMHTEAFIWARQTLAYPTPNFANAKDVSKERSAGSHPGFVDVCGGTFRLGAEKSAPFLFDNEKWAHDVEVKPFSIARAPVTNGEFAEFIAAGGYENRDYWSPEGWKYIQEKKLQHPGYWQRSGGSDWSLKQFDRIIPLPLHQPVIHVNWYEANAYCNWANLRLPTEIEWEVAALGEPGSDGNLASSKRRYPWGDQSPTSAQANLDGRALGCIDVAALPEGDSAFGCRQMLGNVWEWTSDDFNPFPGFEADAYYEYSTMLFGTTKVLRGGGWPTRSRMVHGTYRNYFEPHRWNVFSGFRTCKK